MEKIPLWKCWKMDRKYHYIRCRDGLREAHTELRKENTDLKQNYGARRKRRIRIRKKIRRMILQGMKIVIFTFANLFCSVEIR